MTVSTPVKVVALAALALMLGLGGIVLLFGKHASSPNAAAAVTPPAAKAHFTVKVAPKPKAHKPVVHLLPGLPGVVASALEKRAVAVVAIYDPKVSGDRATLEAARAGAREAHAAFVAANVSLESIASGVASWSDVARDPAVIVVRRPGKVVFAVSELIREATREGRRVALLRCYDGEGVTIVEAELSPVRGGETVRRGPYRFRTATDAFRFVQESLLALQYLGCAVQ